MAFKSSTTIWNVIINKTIEDRTIQLSCINFSIIHLHDLTRIYTIHKFSFSTNYISLILLCLYLHKYQ